MEEVTLEDYLDGAGDDRRDTQEEPDAGVDTDVASSGDGSQSTDRSVTVSYAWSPAGRPCSSCGTVVEQRWRDGDSLDCADCKDW